MALNNITIMGRLTRDPELKYMQSGTATINFTVAVDRDYKDNSGNTPVDFIPVQFMGKQAETIANYFNKGSMIAVIGSMRINKYEKDGQKRDFTFVAGRSFSFVAGGKSEGNQASGQPEFSAVDDDDVPF
ncbi:single-stranded DNA-binding protein [Peptostreptococcus anaerobius]|uniref:single-stranded DNA-binding protein n=1 Tax=Peptostreptococcus anaerobius TaxID=1261 RepID=UPI00232F72E6|nr:single-stranded DNA-binding protein [Peptostreptococcus anaerobius]MDB8821403.1 single-stranded DNA-binding protein [Peptostreptococcus anaerobius]MDB8825951.1 single-stranded DNA-binding protein [Peptostreptococcus anaerobius]MDB8827888.1 single-stranded DNA-binding protein [Peptostreptococcus anaerobius]MDB8829706.1 single-stranded DNA-binding protein [Peptostreptococcus anaerobius]MDB8831568.1 single-stranded DNA-binding protein [Peptostreptococcus anaerobius]